MPSVINAGQASTELGEGGRGPSRATPKPKDGPSALSLLGYAWTAAGAPSGTVRSLRTLRKEALDSGEFAELFALERSPRASESEGEPVHVPTKVAT